jgi:hypothetical protein
MENISSKLNSKRNKLIIISGSFFILLPFIASLGFYFYWGNSIGYSFKWFAKCGAIYPFIILVAIGVISLYSLINNKLLNHNYFYILSACAFIVSIIFFMRGYYLSDINFINLLGSYRIGPVIFQLSMIMSFICSYFLLRVGHILKNSE